MNYSNNSNRHSRKKVLLKRNRRHLRRRSNTNLLSTIVGRENSQRNNEPDMVQILHPLIGKRAVRPKNLRIRNQLYRCDDMHNMKEKKNCINKLYYYTVFVKNYMNDFIQNQTDINANKLIDILIRLKYDSAIILGEENQNEIVKDYLMHLYNLNEEAYFIIEQHDRFNEMVRKIHIPHQSMYNKVRRTLGMRSHRVAPNNRINRYNNRSNIRRNNSRSKFRRRSLKNHYNN